jgi:hypothetical protein
MVDHLQALTVWQRLAGAGRISLDHDYSEEPTLNGSKRIFQEFIS